MVQGGLWARSQTGKESPVLASRCGFWYFSFSSSSVCPCLLMLLLHPPPPPPPPPHHDHHHHHHRHCLRQRRRHRHRHRHRHGHGHRHRRHRRHHRRHHHRCHHHRCHHHHHHRRRHRNRRHRRRYHHRVNHHHRHHHHPAQLSLSTPCPSTSAVFSTRPSPSTRDGDRPPSQPALPPLQLPALPEPCSSPSSSGQQLAASPRPQNLNPNLYYRGLNSDQYHFGGSLL